MDVNGKMIAVETMPGMGEEEDKGEWGSVSPRPAYTNKNYDIL
jgi:hypothetical protein